MQLDPYLPPYTKFKSKWIKDFNISPVRLILIKEKVGNSLECTGDNILNKILVVQTLRSAIKMGSHETENFL